MPLSITCCQAILGVEAVAPEFASAPQEEQEDQEGEDAQAEVEAKGRGVGEGGGGDQRAGGVGGEAGGISEIEHVELAQAPGEPLGHTSQGVSDALHLEAPHARRAQNDPGVRFLPSDGLLGEDDKVPNIPGHEGPALSGGAGKLLSV